MKENKSIKKAIIVAIVTLLLTIAGVIWGINYDDKDIETISNGVETIVDIIDNTQLAEENPSTTEIPELTQEDEQSLAVQEANVGKNQKFEQQGNIAYKGASKTPNVQLGKYQGLTYYSQVDSRWARHPYTIIGDKSQDIANYGCGPTCAAMIVSSIKGTITPPDMGDLFVEYGYESKYDGTYWSAFRWIADVFDLDGYSQFSSVNTAVSKLKNNHYLVAICNEGLFTYGGHFIVITGVEGNTLKIYDPYLYNGKFTTASRKKANVKVKGNTVYVSVDNFKKYANCQSFFSYKYDANKITNNTTTVTTTTTNNKNTNVKNVNYKAKVTAGIGLNIRSGASTKYKIVGGYTYGTTVTITKESNGWGKTNKGWICLDYVKKVSTSTTSTSIKTRDKVKVLNAIQYNGQSFAKNYSSYDVIEVIGDRVVIGKGKTVTCAINKKNIKKI